MNDKNNGMNFVEEGILVDVRILMAEDEPTSQKIVLNMLVKAGCHVDVVQNGKEAIRTLETKHYDVVLMDIVMPEMDGYLATQEIRNPTSKVLNHKIPIIAMTAYVTKGDREACKASGLDGFVPKPVHPEVLYEEIRRQLTAP